MENHDLQYIEQATTLMQRCVNEKEADPKVGAVLVTDHGEVFAAFRGQKGPGNHAEFSLLQKVAVSTDLTAGATLYTTLEPCTARSHNKRSCAQWIIEKRIKRVVIGILDPNREICGKGYWQLVNAGIHVDFFPSAHAQEILRANAVFLRLHQSPVQISTAFAEVSGRFKADYLAPYVEFGIGGCVSLQECPDKRDGWETTQIAVGLETEQLFEIPPNLQPSYESYFEERRQEFTHNGEKFMLLNNPVAFSDAPRTLIFSTFRLPTAQMATPSSNMTERERLVLSRD
jgi:pyrimidine deaminase RibD-like protein